MPNLRRLARDSEDRAADYLIAKGLAVVTRRFKCRRGEIDLICMDGHTVVFVEVKERRGNTLPEEGVGARKEALMREAAAEYGLKMGLGEAPVRFDVVAIDRSGIRHYEDVFGA